MMAEFDLPNATLPVLFPLVASHEENQIEAEMKALFLDMWGEHAAKEAFDLNVSGMAHLGSYELVRRAINIDGLALLPGRGDEARTRYLYRAWTARNHRGRGLHFLRTCLQMLCPNSWEVEQLWQELDKEYTTALHTTEEVEQEGLQGKVFLTSRVDIAIDFAADSLPLPQLMSIVSATIPARFTPVFSKVVAKLRASAQRLAFYTDIEGVTIYPAPWTELTAPDLNAGHTSGAHEIDYVEIFPQ